MSNELIVKKEGQLPLLKSQLKGIEHRRSQFKVTIRKVELPKNNDFNEKIAWICSTFGIFENIDKNKNAASIFKEIFLATTTGQVITSTVIAERLGLSRGATINHLNNLLKSGLIEKGGKYYFARSKTIEGIINEIEDDLIHIFSRMKRIAKEIDQDLPKVIQMK
ncbi:MAG: winged helix-turn-helix transcriptional regulator [Candidatus ainarchaeum sp.]|nr:winged helix-turn-helix transcriptional regulator [Candidatus ainarchaeum sp.]